MMLMLRLKVMAIGFEHDTTGEVKLWERVEIRKSY